jgi:hypothetical protein
MAATVVAGVGLQVGQINAVFQVGEGLIFVQSLLLMNLVWSFLVEEEVAALRTMEVQVEAPLVGQVVVFQM